VAGKSFRRIFRRSTPGSSTGACSESRCNTSLAGRISGRGNSTSIHGLPYDFPDKQAKLTIADVGVGSGILAVVMALEFPKAKVFGIDRAPGALEVATINSSRLNVSDRFKLMQGDLLEPLIRTLGPGSLNVIVSNPPYINDKEAADLAPEIISFEPKDALIAGPTGLEVFKRLVPQVALMLAPGGRLYLECGSGQAEDVAALIGAQEPLAHLRTVADLQGIGRVIVGEKKD